MGPACFACQTECVEPGRIVVVEARRQYGAFPRGGWQLESVQPADDRSQAIDARETMERIHAVPRQQESLKVCRGDRFDFSAEPIQRIAMDARQQATIAPFELVDAGETTAQNRAVGFER